MSRGSFQFGLTRAPLRTATARPFPSDQSVPALTDAASVAKAQARSRLSALIASCLAARAGSQTTGSRTRDSSPSSPPGRSAG